MTHAHAAPTSQRNAILTASPDKLVKLLYEGAIKNLEQCRQQLSDPRTSRSGEAGASMSRAIGIVGELRASLDHAAGGAIAKDLDRLYDFAIGQITQSHPARKPERVGNRLEVLRTLKEGWDAVIPG